MRVQNITSNITFGKTPVMICEMKKTAGNNKINATLYKMDLRDSEDIKEIEYSKTARILYPMLLEDRFYSHPAREYYLLKDDETDEVISCAATSTHLRMNDGKKSGFSLVIDEFAKSSKYLNSSEPMFAFLADKAIKHYNQNIIIGTSECDDETLKKFRFTKTKNGEWYMPERRFSNLINSAEKRYNMIV